MCDYQRNFSTLRMMFPGCLNVLVKDSGRSKSRLQYSVMSDCRAARKAFEKTEMAATMVIVRRPTFRIQNLECMCSKVCRSRLRVS